MTWVFVISFVLVLYPVVLYPLLVVFLARCFGRRPDLSNDVSSNDLSNNSALSNDASLPTISLLCVVRNGEALIRAKLDNCMSLDYPADRLDIVIASDGSTDRTMEIAASYPSERKIRLFDYEGHNGKISAINRTVPESQGEIIVFSDVDALLDRQALRELVCFFIAPEVGGVCGRKYLAQGHGKIDDAQARYVSYEDRIRQAESDLSSIASNEGKLYAIRKSLFRTLPEGVMDDLQVCLGVVAQQFRFLFAPEARAQIPPPVKNRSHEIARRRRIVGPSLFGLLAMRRLFNPFRYGLYALLLFSHKVMRRIMPMFLALWFVSACVLAYDQKIYLIVPLGLVAFYALLAVLKTGLGTMIPGLRPFEKLLSGIDYFLLGNVGTLLGIMDFVLGRRCKKWDPIK